jgi:hypothetical protein
VSVGQVETRGDPAWLELELVRDDWNGSRLFGSGLPSRRVMTSEAVKRHVYLDAETSEALPESPLLPPEDDLNEQDGQLSAEPVELIPAKYQYDVPHCFQFVAPNIVAWAVKKYTPAELSAMRRLYVGRDPWSTYLTELMV